MKKVFLILLILVAIPLYTWDIWLVVKEMKGSDFNRHINVSIPSQDSEDIQTLTTLRSVRFTKQGKNPFLAYKKKPKPVIKKKTGTNKPKNSKTIVHPPRVVIKGIMWNPSNPLAMIVLPNGESTVAKKGQTYSGDIVIQTIEKQRVQVAYKGQKFWISK